jgi:hypothetical protein
MCLISRFKQSNISTFRCTWQHALIHVTIAYVIQVFRRQNTNSRIFRWPGIYFFLHASRIYLKIYIWVVKSFKMLSVLSFYFRTGEHKDYINRNISFLCFHVTLWSYIRFTICYTDTVRTRKGGMLETLITSKATSFKEERYLPIALFFLDCVFIYINLSLANIYLYLHFYSYMFEFIYWNLENG